MNELSVQPMTTESNPCTNVIPRTMFIYCRYYKVITRVDRWELLIVKQCQIAIYPQAKLTSSCCESACMQL